MSSHKKNSHSEKIKVAVDKADHLSEDEKSETIKRLDEWILEDKAEGIFYEELMNATQGMKSILKDLGFI
jgi:DNA-binding SARP family transcriptional activator